jgi:UDPglucose 6-dehydrogenase
MDEILASDHPRMVVVKSTVPPGTSASLMARTPGLAERYAYSPEFLSQGSAIEGWMRPSRIVAGIENGSLRELLEELYRGIEGPWVVTTPTNAEMIKYASNAFLATKISFINEIANLCDEVGATIDDVAAGLGLDPRIGSSFLAAGIGYGGSCFPKDVQALTHLSSLKGRAMPLLQSVVTVNNAQRLRVVRAVQDHAAPGSTVAVLGLAFKPGTDDVREAPSLTVVPELVAQGFRVRIWDPIVAAERIESLFPGADVASGPEEATEDAGVVVVLTEWPQIVDADWERLAKGMAPPSLVIDARNCLDAGALARMGLRYWGIGRAFADQDPNREEGS